jgi:hypothetical protein
MPKYKDCSPFTAKQLLSMELDARGARPTKLGSRLTQPDFNDPAKRITYVLDYACQVIRQLEDKLDAAYTELVLADPEKALSALSLHAHSVRKSRRPRTHAGRKKEG